MTAIKICGITRREDADQAAALGASYLGFVMWRHSPRYIPLDRVRNIVTTLPASVTAVGVFVNPTADEINAATDAGISVAQFCSMPTIPCGTAAPGRWSIGPARGSWRNSGK
jgi:phosphoribosylanthranilate isomerase